MLKAIGLGAAVLVGIGCSSSPRRGRIASASNAWNPFEKKDPHLKGSYGSVASGKGATYAFEGNREVGSGRIAIPKCA